MEEQERLARNMRIRDEAMRAVEEENARMAREAAIDRCDPCIEARIERDDVLTLPNGVQCWLYARHCLQPGAECTAAVQIDFMAESHEVADRLVERLIAIPAVRTLGVSAWRVLMPGARLSLSCRFPVLQSLISIIGTSPIEQLRHGALPANG